MPCSSPLKQLQTSFQKPSGWGSPTTMTHRTVLLILHIFQYWLWLNTLMGRPKYIINELAFPSQIAMDRHSGAWINPTSLLFSLMFPNRWEDPLVLNHHLRLDPSNITIPFSSRPALSCEENNAASTTWKEEKHGHGSLLVSQSQTRPNQASFSSFGLFFFHFGINFVLAHRALWLREYERLTSGYYRNPKWLASSVHHTFAAETNTLIQATHSQGKKAMSSAKSNQRAAYMAYIQIKYGVRFQNGFHEFRQLGGIKIFHQAQNRWNCAAMWDSTGPSGKGVAKTWT